PTLPRFCLFRADGKIGAVTQLVSDLRHAHKTGIHAQDVEVAPDLLLRRNNDAFKLNVIEKILRVIVVSDGTNPRRFLDRTAEKRAMKLATADDANAAHRNRVAPIVRCRMDRRAASGYIRSGYPACQAIDIGVIPSATVVPTDEHIAGCGMILNRPNN